MYINLLHTYVHSITPFVSITMTIPIVLLLIQNDKLQYKHIQGCMISTCSYVVTYIHTVVACQR